MASDQGGLRSPIEFDIRVPVSDGGLLGNVLSALMLGLREIGEYEPASGGTIKIIANGPSARGADLKGPTLALNGALRLFAERGLAPTYWAACDPQELVADFLGDAPPRSTIYLVASKCHPKVFERLHGYNVLVWHLDDAATYPAVADRFPVGAWVSITLCAFELMARLGFRRFETWGWDGCFLEGEGHAAPQIESPDVTTVEVQGGGAFQSTHTWALEAQTALTRLAGFPFRVHVHGPGMIGAILKTFLPNRIVTDAAG